uniref:Uncharacterized protein n=1 Tax=Physcomitrium patens TaxID=3218 RepID=A0A2K1J437_PHYPA|nr:hypothetical protein PHYPA_022145 [Physcomitrium patens]
MARCWSSFFRRNVAFASLFREEELLNGAYVGSSYSVAGCGFSVCSKSSLSPEQLLSSERRNNVTAHLLLWRYLVPTSYSMF